MHNEKNIVIKIGTSSLTYDDGTLNKDIIKDICEATTILKQRGHKIILVSSGAIGAGLSQLGCHEKPQELSLKQAIAAVGQTILMQTYQEYYAMQNQLCAQILLTNDIIAHPVKRDNVRQTIHKLHELNVIPIVNENDSVSTVEIESTVFSDNDTLSAIVSILVDADMLLLFSDVDGLYKKKNGVLTKEILTYVSDLSDVNQHVSSQSSALGRGGMRMKIKAIDLATKEGIDVVLSNITTVKNLDQIISEKTIGTFFKGGVKDDNKKNWTTS